MTEPEPAQLTSDRAVRDLVEQIVGEAIRPQCWVLLLDGDDRPLPVALPIDDQPMSADPDETTRFAVALDGIADGTGASAVVLALERPGPDDLTPTESAWAGNLRRSFLGRRTRLRALVLVHDRGIRILADAAVPGSAFHRPARAG